MINETTKAKSVIIEAHKGDKPVVAEKITGNPKTPVKLTIK
jgi:hypothetical protein